MLIQSGVDIHTVLALLGHKSLRMTARYAHLAPENLRSAVDVLDEREKRLHFGDSRAKEKGLQCVTP
jgi:integrase